MNEFISKIAKDKITIEKDIYELKKFLNLRNDETADQIRHKLDGLAHKKHEIQIRLENLKEALESTQSSGTVDSTKLGVMQKIHSDAKALEKLLAKNVESIEEKIKLRFQSHIRLSQGKSTIDMDEEAQRHFRDLTTQNDLTNDANQKADKILEMGMNVLGNLNSQKSKASRIISTMTNIRKDLKVSDWTASAVVKRVQEDRRLVFLLFAASMVVILTVYFICKRK
jgi:hypothetical protein